jgi:hypothetical protein
MKKSIVLFAIIFSLFSCSKDDEPTSDATSSNYRVKTQTTISGSNTYVQQYEYNANGKISKLIYQDGEYAIYSYNSSNLLIKVQNYGNSAYDILYTTFTYTPNGNLDEKIACQRQTGSTILNKYKFNYTYSNNKVMQELQYQWSQLSNNWSNPSTTNYEYNANGKLSKINEISNSRYFLMTYDANNNITKTDQYDLKSGSTTQYYLRRSTTRTFDTKKANNTSFSEFPNYFNPNYYVSGGNNLVDVVDKYYTEAGVVENSSAYTNTYQYNEAGYPTKMSGGAFNEEYVLEKY